MTVSFSATSSTPNVIVRNADGYFVVLDVVRKVPPNEFTITVTAEDDEGEMADDFVAFDVQAVAPLAHTVEVTQYESGVLQVRFHR